MFGLLIKISPGRRPNGSLTKIGQKIPTTIIIIPMTIKTFCISKMFLQVIILKTIQWQPKPVLVKLKPHFSPYRELVWESHCNFPKHL